MAYRRRGSYRRRKGRGRRSAKWMSRYVPSRQRLGFRR